MVRRGPGRYSCEFYRWAWAIDARGRLVMEHINNCEICGPIINGDGIRYIGSIEEVARANIRRRRRRRFLKRAAAVLLLAGSAGGVGYTVFRSTHWEASPPGTDRHEAVIKNVVSPYEDALARDGTQGVEKLLARADAAEMQHIFDWIGRNQRSSCYYILVGALTHPDPFRRRVAQRALSRIPPAQLPPHLAALSAAEQAESDPLLHDSLHYLVQLVTNS